MLLREMDSPQVFETIAGVRAAVGARSRGMSVGFVPTMGALHSGHASLMERARKGNDFVIASIFVNPTQFGPGEDFQTYPRDLAGDLAALGTAGVDAVFAPTVTEMYPTGAVSTAVAPGPLAETLEGAHRPGHFAGVATVCAQLFNIVQPDRVYLGEKDAQQVAVLRQMVADLHMPLEIVACPTVRDPDGLAMSSRNRRLSPEDRSAAEAIPAALFAARERVQEGEFSAQILVAHARQIIDQRPLVRLQYLEVVDPRTFQPVDRVAVGSLMVLAAIVSSVRLIDNMQVGQGVAFGDIG